jgi:RNA polymerase sigma-70 factor, ECF subfamily
MGKLPGTAPQRKQKFNDDLIARGISGDKDAREELAMMCLPRVWRTVYLACGGGPDVDDIAQNALIDAFNGLASFRGSGDFSSWLNRITVRAVYRHTRKRSIWSIVSASDRVEIEPDTQSRRPDQKTEERRIFEALAHHLSKIKLKNRMALILSAVHGYSMTEIAAVEGCNIEAAKKRLQRGRTELGNLLKKDPYLREILSEVGI